MSKRKDGGWQQAGGIMESKNENVKVPLISKIAYGFGDVGCNFSWMFVSNFLMIFYTDVFGISMAAVSALMLFSRFWDASMASHCSSDHGRASDYDILGTSGLVGQIKGYLYGNYILSAGTWIYLCKYPVWHPLWSNDTGYR